jgi:SAM-dependent methyltransferase
MNMAIFDLVQEYARGSDHPDLIVYRRDLEGKNPLHSVPFSGQAWLNRMAYYCRAGNFFDSRILEVGCGFGWDAVAISKIGNNRVTASDILPSMIDGVRDCLAAMKRKGKSIEIEPLVADICDNNLPPESFDGIYSSEAVEHVHDLSAMFKECYRLLRPGKRLLIANDSNRWNARLREDAMKMWAERDTSHAHVDWLKTEIRPVEHQNAKPYAVMREEMIRGAVTPLAEPDVKKLVFATAGMVRQEIENATRTYVATGELPIRPEFSWCRNPETGEYAERLLDPFELQDMLNSAGFVTTLGHAFTKLPFNYMNFIHSRMLSKAIFGKRRLFLLCAEKPA